MAEMKDGRICLSKEGALNVAKELLHPNTEAMKKRNKSIAEAKNYTYLKKLIYKIKIRRGKRK